MVLEDVVNAQVGLIYVVAHRSSQSEGTRATKVGGGKVSGLSASVSILNPATWRSDEVRWDALAENEDRLRTRRKRLGV